MHGFVRKMEMYLEMNFIFPTGVRSPETVMFENTSFLVNKAGDVDYHADVITDFGPVYTTTSVSYSYGII